MADDIREKLGRDDLVALKLRASDWPRHLLSATLIPDAWMGLKLAADGRRAFVPAGEAPQLDRDDVLLLVRSRALTIPLEFDHVQARDRHTLRGRVELLLRWEPRETELAALAESLVAERDLTLPRLADALHAADAVAALRRFVAESDAEPLVAGARRDAALEHLRAALERFCFRTGATIERLGHCAFDSESLRHARLLAERAEQRVAAIEARRMVEQAAAEATRQRLDHLGDLLAKLRASATNDSQDWHDLLPALAPPERGKLLENLWRLTPNETIAAAIAVVAGNSLALLDPQSAAQLTHRVEIPDELGPLRSVTYDAAHAQLLLGAARGVWVVSPAGELVQRLAISAELDTPRTGFNSAARTGDTVFATHSQLGVWRWKLGEHCAAPQTTQLLSTPEGTRAVRAATVDDSGALWFAIDGSIWTLAPDDAAPREFAIGVNTICHVCPHRDALFVSTTVGELFRVQRTQPDDWWLLHRTADVLERFAIRQWRDLCEVLTPALSGGVQAIYDEQQVAARVIEHPTAVRRIWACDDAIVGLSKLRDRLLISTTAGGVTNDVPIARLLHQSVADATIVTSQSNSKQT